MLYHSTVSGRGNQYNPLLLSLAIQLFGNICLLSVRRFFKFAVRRSFRYLSILLFLTFQKDASLLKIHRHPDRCWTSRVQRTLFDDG